MVVLTVIEEMSDGMGVVPGKGFFDRNVWI